MEVAVRLSSGLAQSLGSSHLRVMLEDGATLAALLERLCADHPQFARQLSSAVAVVAGQTVSLTEPLRPGQEVALLTPVSGGCF